MYHKDCKTSKTHTYRCHPIRRRWQRALKDGNPGWQDFFRTSLNDSYLKFYSISSTECEAHKKADILVVCQCLEMGYHNSAVGYMLSVICYLLDAICYMLYVVCYMLDDICFHHGLFDRWPAFASHVQELPFNLLFFFCFGQLIRSKECRAFIDECM